MQKDDDIYVQTFIERRADIAGRRGNDSHAPPCLPLRVLARNSMNSDELLKELRESIKEFRNEHQEFRDDVTDRITRIESTISNQRSFISGAGWLLGMLGAFAVWAYDKLNIVVK